MDLLVNDLSVHEQFHELSDFRLALSRLMALREVAKSHGREVKCNCRFLESHPKPGVAMQAAIHRMFAERERRSIMAWLTRSGPFWDEARRHSEDDYLEFGGEVVTDTALGEAAFQTMHGVRCGLVSLDPSAWCYTPFEVTWVRLDEELRDQVASVENWWDPKSLGPALQKRPRRLQSWNDLCRASHERFKLLTFSQDCFDHLAGETFSKSSSDSFLRLLGILDKLSRAVDAEGKRSKEGDKIYRDHFTGDRALFSDSSKTEKQRFRKQLTFIDPENPGESLFCPWHGKVSHGTLRLHFSWPAPVNRPIQIVYAGPKITKR